MTPQDKCRQRIWPNEKFAVEGIKDVADGAGSGVSGLKGLRFEV
jgi:hypothetical protein